MPAGKWIRTWRDPASRGAGGYAFAHDPDVPAACEPPIWLPEHFPGTVIVHPAPPGFADRTGFDPNVLGVIVADRSHADGRELVVGDATGRIHVCLRHTDSTHRHAVIVPVDGAFRLRLDVLSRVALRLQGRCTHLLPPALRLTSLQRSRLIHLLHTFDVHEYGGPRRVAAEVLSSKQASLPSVEWKDSAARRRAIRLIRDSIALVERGYLKLLRGG